MSRSTVDHQALQLVGRETGASSASPLIRHVLRTDLQYCILHGWPRSLAWEASDLDIALAPADLGKLEEAVQQASGTRIVQLLQHEASCYHFVLATSEGKGSRLISLDVATDYRRDGCVFFSATELLRGRRRVDGLWVAAPEVELAYLLVKKILKGMFHEGQRARLRDLCSLLGEEAYAIGRRVLGPRWGHVTIDRLVESRWPIVEVPLPRLKRALRWQILRRHPLNASLYWLAELRRRWRRWRYPTGMCVAVLGSDGAGKSTLISRLKENVRGAFRHTAAFHLRPSTRESRENDAPSPDPHGQIPYPSWLSCLKVAYYTFVYVWGYYLHVRPRLVRSSLVLFDRYYDDLMVDMRRYRYGGPAWLVRLAALFIPKPDMYLVLDVPEEQLLSRKQEVTRETLEHQREAYRRFARSRRSAVLLDGSLPVDELAAGSSDVILDYLHQRYLKRRSILFRARRPEDLGWLACILGAHTD